MTEKGKKTVGQGQKTEQLVQRKLWKYGYNVERMPHMGGHRQSFDLIIDKKFRIDVKSSTRKQKNNKFSFMLNRGIEKDVDVYAFVFIYDEQIQLIRYITRDNLLSNFTSSRLSISLSVSDEFLQKSPLKIFGEPRIKMKEFLEEQGKMRKIIDPL